MADDDFADKPTAEEQQRTRVLYDGNKADPLPSADTSQPGWTDAPDWQKDSARAGVRAIALNPPLTPEQSHDGWLEQKRADGWTYSATKNPALKQHPCFVPYADLPAAQRAKDDLFGAAVRAVLGIE